MWFIFVILGLLVLWAIATFHFIWKLLKTPVRELRAQGFTHAKISDVRNTFPQWVRKDEKYYYVIRQLRKLKNR